MAVNSLTIRRFLTLIYLFLVTGGCAGPAIHHHPPIEKKVLARMGYTVQAGAFSVAENASRLTTVLQRQGINATCFVAEEGLYKVRLGNFSTRAAARDKAESLQMTGIIEEYYIISPGQYAAAQKGISRTDLRREIVKTARSFLGVPYLWGGADADNGFDCSGLTMTVYQLNGLDLPRTSGEQAQSGSPVARDTLSPGDLVFFHTRNGRKISHVGIYLGDDLFMHAPGKDKKIRVDPLSGEHYRHCFAGGRSYI